eukprot:g3716.t1
MDFEDALRRAVVANKVENIEVPFGWPQMPKPKPLQGWMEKLKTKKGTSRFLPSWNARYFIVKPEKRQLSYYRTSSHTKKHVIPRGFIDLETVSDVTRVDEISFHIRSKRKSMLLRCSSCQSCDTWFSTISMFTYQLSCYRENLTLVRDFRCLQNRKKRHLYKEKVKKLDVANLEQQNISGTPQSDSSLSSQDFLEASSFPVFSEEVIVPQVMLHETKRKKKDASKDNVPRIDLRLDSSDSDVELESEVVKRFQSWQVQQKLLK